MMTENDFYFLKIEPWFPFIVIFTRYVAYDIFHFTIMNNNTILCVSFCCCCCEVHYHHLNTHLRNVTLDIVYFISLIFRCERSSAKKTLASIWSLQIRWIQIWKLFVDFKNEAVLSWSHFFLTINAYWNCLIDRPVLFVIHLECPKWLHWHWNETSVVEIK